MNNTQIKLVALDLDGTLLDEDKKIPRETIETIRAVREKGIEVTLASSRPFCAVLPYARELNITLPVIAHGGAVVADGEKIISRQTLEPDSSRAVIRLLEDHEYYIKVYCDDILYVQEATAETAEYSRLFGVEFREVGRRRLTSLPETPVRIAILDEQPRRIEQIPGLIGGYLRHFALASDTSYGLEIVDSTVNKGNAVSALCVELGLNMREVMAIGNEGNDMEMIKMAGLGVAMGNACAELKQAADAVTRANTESGVDYALKQYILQG